MVGLGHRTDTLFQQWVWENEKQWHGSKQDKTDGCTPPSNSDGHCVHQHRRRMDLRHPPSKITIEMCNNQFPMGACLKPEEQSRCIGRYQRDTVKAYDQGIRKSSAQ